MQNVSNNFREELNNDNRRYIKSCSITLSDGTIIQIDNSHIWGNGFKIEDAVSNSDSFDIGSSIIGKFTLILNNIYDDFSAYDFTDAVISNIKIGLELSDDVIESVSKGVFTVDETGYSGSIITLECLDNMSKLDRPYSESRLTYPATLGAIVRDACSCCGVSLAADSASFENDDFVVPERPDDSSLTFRQVLCWVGQISCHWCKCNADGELTLGWYDTATLEKIQAGFDGGTMKPWTTGDTIDGGTMNPWTTGDSIDGGSFDWSRYHHIYSMSSMNICTDDVVITGIKVVEKTDEDTDITYQSGIAGYVLSIEGNDFIQDGKGAEVAEYLGTKLIGLRFRPLTVGCLSDPSIEAGDVAVISDRKGNSYPTLITSTTFTAGNYQQISCGAETPMRNSAQRFSETTRIYQELRKRLSRQKSEWEKAVDDLTKALAESSGLFITKEEQEDGSYIYYMHNKKTLGESDIIWKITAEAFGISTDGGKTYPFGFKVTGEMITKILNTIGINADWINTGSFVVKDANGNIIMSADCDTGRVEIHPDVFTLSGKTVEQIAGDVAASTVKEGTNLLKSPLDLTTSYWARSGILTSGIEDPDGGTEAFKLTANGTDCFVSASGSNRPLKSAGETYKFSVWLKASAETDIKISLGHTNGKIETVSLTTSWKRYTISQQINTVTSANNVTIGGWGSYSTENGADIFVYNPYVEYADPYRNKEEIMDTLTDGGQNQGIYLKDGKIYVNGEYIRSLLVTADMIQVEELAALSATIGGFLIESKRIRNTSGDGSKAMYIGSYDWNNSDALVVQALSDDAWKNLLMMKYDGSIASKNVEQVNEAVLSAGALTFKGRASASGSWVNKMTFTPDGMKSPRNNYFMLSEDADNYDTLTSSAASGWAQNKLGNTLVYGTLEAKILKVTGSKSIIMQTEDYGQQQFYCHETPSPMLGDLGEGRIADDGICVVDIDDVFRESVNTEIKYYVFLQKEWEGDCWVSEQTDTYFVVRGTPGLKFDYEIKARQRGMESVRFNDSSDISALMLTEPDYESELYAEYEEELQQEAMTETAYFEERAAVINEVVSSNL